MVSSNRMYYIKSLNQILCKTKVKFHWQWSYVLHIGGLQTKCIVYEVYIHYLTTNFKSSFVYLFHNQIQYIVVCRDRFRFYRLHHFDRCSDEGRDLTGRHTSSLWTPWYSYSWTLSHRPYRSHHSDRDPTHTWWCLLNSCGQYNLQFYNKLSKGIWNNYIHSY